MAKQYYGYDPTKKTAPLKSTLPLTQVDENIQLTRGEVPQLESADKLVSPVTFGRSAQRTVSKGMQGLLGIVFDEAVAIGNLGNYLDQRDKRDKARLTEKDKEKYTEAEQRILEIQKEEWDGQGGLEGEQAFEERKQNRIQQVYESLNSNVTTNAYRNQVTRNILSSKAKYKDTTYGNYSEGYRQISIDNPNLTPEALGKLHQDYLEAGKDRFGNRNDYQRLVQETAEGQIKIANAQLITTIDRDLKNILPEYTLNNLGKEFLDAESYNPEDPTSWDLDSLSSKLFNVILSNLSIPIDKGDLNNVDNKIGQYVLESIHNHLSSEVYKYTKAKNEEDSQFAKTSRRLLQITSNDKTADYLKENPFRDIELDNIAAEEQLLILKDFSNNTRDKGPRERLELYTQSVEAAASHIFNQATLSSDMSIARAKEYAETLFNHPEYEKRIRELITINLGDDNEDLDATVQSYMTTIKEDFFTGKLAPALLKKFQTGIKNYVGTLPDYFSPSDSELAFRDFITSQSAELNGLLPEGQRIEFVRDLELQQLLLNRTDQINKTLEENKDLNPDQRLTLEADLANILSRSLQAYKLDNVGVPLFNVVDEDGKVIKNWRQEYADQPIMDAVTTLSTAAVSLKKDLAAKVTASNKMLDNMRKLDAASQPFGKTVNHAEVNSLYKLTPIGSYIDTGDISVFENNYDAYNQDYANHQLDLHARGLLKLEMTTNEQEEAVPVTKPLDLNKLRQGFSLSGEDEVLDMYLSRLMVQPFAENINAEVPDQVSNRFLNFFRQMSSPEGSGVTVPSEEQTRRILYMWGSLTSAQKQKIFRLESGEAVDATLMRMFFNTAYDISTNPRNVPGTVPIKSVIDQNKLIYNAEDAMGEESIRNEQKLLRLGNSAIRETILNFNRGILSFGKKSIQEMADAIGAAATGDYTEIPSEFANSLIIAMKEIHPTGNSMEDYGIEKIDDTLSPEDATEFLSMFSTNDLESISREITFISSAYNFDKVSAARYVLGKRQEQNFTPVLLPRQTVLAQDVVTDSEAFHMVRAHPTVFEGPNINKEAAAARYGRDTNTMTQLQANMLAVMDSGLNNEEADKLTTALVTLAKGEINIDALKQNINNRMVEKYPKSSPTERAANIPRGLIYEEAIKLNFKSRDPNFNADTVPPYTTWTYSPKNINADLVKQRLISQIATPGLPMQIRLGNEDIDFGAAGVGSLETLPLDFSQILVYNSNLITQNTRNKFEIIAKNKVGLITYTPDQLEKLAEESRETLIYPATSPEGSSPFIEGRSIPFRR